MTFYQIRGALLAICVMTAGQLAAQDATCHDAVENGRWIGGTADNSDIAAADTYAEQMALLLDGNRYITLFSLGRETEIRVEAAGRGNGDPTLLLLNEDDAMVASDDDSGGNGAARLETTLAAGTYCAVVRSFDDSPMTAFVRVGKITDAPLTPGLQTGPDVNVSNLDTPICSTARDLGTLSGDVLTYTASVAEVPFARFAVDGRTTFSVTAVNPDADPIIQIMTATGEVIAENDDFEGLNARIDISTPLTPGTYCIGIDAITDTSLPVVVSIGPYDAEMALAGVYARGEAAPPPGGSVSLTDLGLPPGRWWQDVQVGSDAVWFSMTLEAAGLTVVEAIATGPSGDPWLVIYDDLGREIAQDDDSGQDNDALIFARTTPGTYLIGLRQVSEQSGFVRLLIERYAPVP